MRYPWLTACVGTWQAEWGVQIRDAEASFREIDMCVWPRYRALPHQLTWLDQMVRFGDGPGVAGTAGGRSCLKSFAPGPSSSICAPKKAMQEDHQPSLVATWPKSPSSPWLRRQRSHRVVVARSLEPAPALWGAATAPVPMERALILRGARLASRRPACRHQDPLATLWVRCTRAVAPWQAATTISGLRSNRHVLLR